MRDEKRSNPDGLKGTQRRSILEFLLTVARVQLAQQVQIGELRAQQTATSTARLSGRNGWWSTVKEWGSNAILIHKLWQVWRAISWPVNIGFWGSFLAKWLGWF